MNGYMVDRIVNMEVTPAAHRSEQFNQLMLRLLSKDFQKRPSMTEVLNLPHIKAVERDLEGHKQKLVKDFATFKQSNKSRSKNGQRDDFLSDTSDQTCSNRLI